MIKPDGSDDGKGMFDSITDSLCIYGCKVPGFAFDAGSIQLHQRGEFGRSGAFQAVIGIQENIGFNVRAGKITG